MALEDFMLRLFVATADWKSLIHCDRNHVQRESHFKSPMWVHRKDGHQVMKAQRDLVKIIREPRPIISDKGV